MTCGWQQLLVSCGAVQAPELKCPWEAAPGGVHGSPPTGHQVQEANMPANGLLQTGKQTGKQTGCMLAGQLVQHACVSSVQAGLPQFGCAVVSCAYGPQWLLLAHCSGHHGHVQQVANRARPGVADNCVRVPGVCWLDSTPNIRLTPCCRCRAT